MNVAILLWNEVDLLAFSGPGQLFARAGEGGAFHVYTVAETRRPVTSGDFLTIIPEYTIKNCPRPDVLVVPGGGTFHIVYCKSLLDWLRAAVRPAQAVLVVSDGIDVLRAAGAPDLPDPVVLGRSGGDAALEAGSPSGNEIVEQGKVVVALSASVAIEAALLVIARLCGEPLARDAARCAGCGR
ncbi:MAG TPA: DJ-1/PfpI family protein [Rhodothermales bacterium]|nr:DJ-1/PfpI family protein [Rhodothermales bacterium]